MILVIGYSSDSTIANLIDCAKTQETKLEFFDLDDLLTCKDMRIFLKSGLVIHIDGRIWDFSNYTAFYQRIYFKSPKSVSRGDMISKLLHILGNYLNSTNATVVNRPNAGFHNSLKLYHAHRMRSSGFNVPDTHVFGSRHEAERFLTIDHSWISKGCSGIRTRAEAFDGLMFCNLDLLEYTPSLFQHRIVGPDVRVHVIGHETIALQINSPNIDYRYDGSSNEYRAITPPLQVTGTCLKFCENENLLFAGIDFKVHQDGTWHALEANAMPGYDFYDRKLNFTISRALLRLLTSKIVNRAVYSVERPFISIERVRMDF